jgi:hypothetical protein
MVRGDDPYVPPRSSELTAASEPRDTQLRGVLWFGVPVLFVVVALFFLDYLTLRRFDGGDIKDAGAAFMGFVIPAAFVGRLIHRRGGSTWLRYLGFALLLGLAWGSFLYFVVAVSQPAKSWSFAMLVKGTARAMGISIPVTLLLATTLRFYDRWRP